MRFGFNDQGGHLTPATDATRGWVTAARVPVMPWTPMETIDQYAYALAHVRPIFCIYTTDHEPDANAIATQAQAISWRHSTAAIQAFNEPNGETYGSVHPIYCRDVVRHVRNAVRPGTKVIGPPMTPTGAWRDYFRQVYPIPGVSPALHLYPNSPSWATEVDSQIALAKGAMGGTGSWHVTECGMGYEHYGVRQADLSVKLYKKVANKGAADCIFHSLTRLPGDWEDRQRLWVVEDDNSLSAIGRALRAQRT
jgi:hypothetical protein